MANIALAENIHMLLLDPVEDASVPDSWVQFQPLRRCGLVAAGVCQAFSALATLGVLASWDSAHCNGWPGGYYQLTAGLVCFSAAPGCCFSWIALRKRRPRFVYIAGAFLFANTWSLSFMNVFFYGSCTGRSAFRFTAAPGMMFNALAAGLLQMAILFKVEALLASPAQVLRSILKATGAPVLLFLLMHTGVVLGFFPWQLMYIECILVLLLMALISAFTALAAHDILRSRELLCKAKLEEAIHCQHRKTLAVHAVVTVAANGTMLLSLGATAICLSVGFRGSVGWLLVVAMGVDNVLNVICMVLLSGLFAALYRAWGRVDVISEISLAGQEARRKKGTAMIGNLDVDATGEAERHILEPAAQAIELHAADTG